MLFVSRAADSSSYPSILHFDWYVPVKYETSTKIEAGGRYVEIGASTKQRIELVLDDDLLLRGFTWLISDDLGSTGFPDENECSPGLPYLQVGHASVWSRDVIPVLELDCPIALCRPARHADIRIGTAQTFDRCLSHGRVRFLILGDKLVGLRVADLTDEERAGLEDYIARHVSP